MWLACAACVGVFGDRQGHRRALVPTRFLNEPLTHVELLHKFHKPWSPDKYSAKLLGQDVFVKVAGVRAEYAYYKVGLKMGYEDILLPSRFDLERNIMITPLLPVKDCGRDVRCRDNCANPAWGSRHAMVAALDYVMGHIDRPMNCFYLRGLVFSIDNDSMTEHDDIPKHANNDYQWQYVPDRAPLQSLCSVLPGFRPLQLNLSGVRTDKILSRHAKLMKVCAK